MRDLESPEAQWDILCYSPICLLALY